MGIDVGQDYRCVAVLGERFQDGKCFIVMDDKPTFGSLSRWIALQSALVFEEDPKLRLIPRARR
ncbi:hypothetical protein LCM4579_22395 [Ensifer sp. LCM 4579]|nr:hypothetical protein LCM4579_22395 [Ensifer sp. LCM 4579]